MSGLLIYFLCVDKKYKLADMSEHMLIPKVTVCYALYSQCISYWSNSITVR